MPTKTRHARTRTPDWASFSDDELLNLRFCDLKLRIAGTPIEARIQRLYEDLERAGLAFRPHYWISDEWFSPDGIPGIAIPFYLAHRRLANLERKMMLEVEGWDEAWCLQILRHEAGHAIDNAYRLHRRSKWREMFGKYTEPYPEFYRPKPYSKSYVIHLDAWYAQSHPSEDFAETFAVWLKPRSGWRTQYDGWPALKKLEYVDELMAEIAEEKQLVNTRRHIDAVTNLKKTLREHYEEKCARYAVEFPSFYDADLHKLFTGDPEDKNLPTAASVLRKHRSQLRKSVAHWTGEYQYTIDQVLSEMIGRCQQLGLRADSSGEAIRRDALILLTVLTMNYLHEGRHRLAL